MGFFSILASRLSSMQDTFNKKLIDNAIKLRGNHTSELEKMLNTVENNAMQMSIIIAIVLRRDYSLAIRCAKENQIRRNNFESLLSDNRVMREIREFLREWPKEF